MKASSLALALGLALVLVVGPERLHAADLVMQSSTFKRPVYFQENGNVRPLGRIFPGLNAGDIPPYGTFRVMSNTGGTVAAIVDNHIFLKGSVFQNWNNLAGTVKIKRADGTPIATIDNWGNLYVDNIVNNPASCVSPAYEPHKWNTLDNIQWGNNCYNYANNQLTYTWSQPGRASGSTVLSYTVDRVRTASLNDGLIWVGWDFPGIAYTCANSGTLLFMTVDPNEDYHWYRLDKLNANWTHKPSSGEATDKDASGNPIFNPLLANRNYGNFNYTENGGFYCTCGSDANVR